MNIFSKLPFLKPDLDSDEALTPEQVAAEEKAANIEFHRTSVRNGPASFKRMTNGQIRRARQRGILRGQKKAYRAEVKNYFEKQRYALAIRPHLQIVGLIPFVDGHEADLRSQVQSTAWLVQRFGAEIEVDGVGTGHVSFLAEDVIAALQNACRFYKAATGQIITVPEGFIPAISLAEDAV